MEKIIKLLFSTLVLMFVALPMTSCSDDPKDEPQGENWDIVGDEFYNADVPTNPAKGNIGYEGGQVKFQVLYSGDQGKLLNPSSLVGKDSVLYCNLHVTRCEISDVRAGENLAYGYESVMHEDGSATFKGEQNVLKEVKVRKEIGNDGYLCFIVDVPENPWPDTSIVYEISYESTEFEIPREFLNGDYRIAWWRDNIKIFQSSK